MFTLSKNQSIDLQRELIEIIVYHGEKLPYSKTYISDSIRNVPYKISGLLNTSYKVEDGEMILLLRFLFSSITYKFLYFESNLWIFLSFCMFYNASNFRKSTNISYILPLVSQRCLWLNVQLNFFLFFFCSSFSFFCCKNCLACNACWTSDANDCWTNPLLSLSASEKFLFLIASSISSSSLL